MKPTLTKNGRVLLRNALAAIKRRPETFKMRVWMRHDPRVKGTEPYCGTVACLAGHIVLAAGGPPMNAEEYKRSALRGETRRAAKHLTDWGDDTVVISQLAAQLVTGERDHETLHNVFGAIRCTTHEKIKARVDRWLKTGK